MSTIKELEKKILAAASVYYNGSSIMSDEKYDAFVDELAKLDPKNLAIIGVGAEPVSNWEKVAHKVVMGSLLKVNTQEEFVKWANDYTNNDFFITAKLDGISISLVYENGKLVQAVSRGGGTIGENILPNVARMGGVPLIIKNKMTATIRGEILLSKENWKKYFPDYSNARNAASGIARDYDGTRCDKLDVLVYKILTDDVDVATEHQQLDLLQELGFKTPVFYEAKSADEVLDIKNKFEESLRDAYPYDLDGLVVSNPSLRAQDEFGTVDARPRAARAYKFKSFGKETVIRDIINQVGNTGRVSPVAVFDDVDLLGAITNRASLYNYGYIEELGIDVGAKVIVVRANDVIPRVDEVIVGTRTTYKTPTNCPICNSTLIVKGEYLSCLNKMGCSAHIGGRIKIWVSDLNILELGEGVIEKLVESKLVKDPSDLYKLTIDQIAGLDRMGKKSATNIHKSLWSVNPVPLHVFVGALSISMIGSSSITLLIDAGYDTLEKLANMTVDQVAAVKGMGDVKSQSFVEGMKDNKEIIAKLLANGVKIKEKIVGNLSGFSFCLTGAMVNKRAVLEQMIVDAGGTVKGSVGKGVDLLVINDLESTSSKAVSAKKNGTKLINEDQLLEMINK
jgi:DNA ligase (NAD+)